MGCPRYQSFLLVRHRAQEETSALMPAGRLWLVPILESGLSSQNQVFKSLVALLICLLQKKKNVCETSVSQLWQKFIISYVSIDAIGCFHVFWSQFKVKHLEGKKNHITSPLRKWPPPGNWRTFQLDGDKKRGQGSHVCPQLPGEQARDPLLSSHLSFPHLLLCPPHKHYSASVPYLSK